MATQGWQIVQRRRARAVTNNPAAPFRTPALTKELTVYDGLRPTYAQTLGHNLSPIAPTPALNPTLPVATSPPKAKIQPPSIISSPDSPVTLRFPPKPAYEEWHRRCFRCFRLGHRSNQCTNARRCVICWNSGHSYEECPDAKRLTPVSSLVSSPAPPLRLSHLRSPPLRL